MEKANYGFMSNHWWFPGSYIIRNLNIKLKCSGFFYRHGKNITILHLASIHSSDQLDLTCIINPQTCHLFQYQK